jgi:hypothetical protein
MQAFSALLSPVSPEPRTGSLFGFWAFWAFGPKPDGDAAASPKEDCQDRNPGIWLA